MTKFVNVKRFARGATWPSGDPRYCTTCAYDGGSRRKQAVVVADRKGRKFRLPVAYCEGHVPAQLRGVSA